MSLKIPQVTTLNFAYYTTKVCYGSAKHACLAMELPKVTWIHYIALTNKFAKTFLAAVSLDVDAAYQDFCNTIKKAAKKTVPCGYRNNYVPCLDAECESLYKTFLQSPQRDHSSLAATALLAKLDRKRRD